MCHAQKHNVETPVRLERAVSSQALYHWATALPPIVENLISQLKYITIFQL